ncbi:TetR/AcrR family transcriptional regulator [Alkaliphilus peptidifermentans]|uniref:Transcriptional regulator, TetR family n=1 Tax=Alkaliphilus peptidifermentans DSM 18978 TaxID=1120976 RepID=A0A1G5IKC5_9FIRM|nr:TetR/AcrR family transcriptional regulator [Alkaliphilus peptidifermentans]SCY76565.1 transcriptional regulator, TetR family [Alkaliphilus peptidifermentans DSM 18978]
MDIIDIKQKPSVKEKIIDAAWKLFLEQGYKDTTVNQIIETSKTSRGAFYHHFHGKEEILFYIAYYFDADYVNWLSSIKPNLKALDKLLEFNLFVMKNLEDSPYRPLLATLYGMQVITTGKRHIMNPEREYYKIVSSIMKEGIENGEITSHLSYLELTEWYSIIERGLTYDWCLSQGRYSLVQYGQRMIKSFIYSISNKDL